MNEMSIVHMNIEYRLKKYFVIGINSSQMKNADSYSSIRAYPRNLDQLKKYN